MLLQTDMFLEHQYSTGWAEGERKTAQPKGDKAAQKGSCRANARFPPCAMMGTDSKSWLIIITLGIKQLDINWLWAENQKTLIVLQNRGRGCADHAAGLVLDYFLSSVIDEKQSRLPGGTTKRRREYGFVWKWGLKVWLIMMMGVCTDVIALVMDNLTE